MKNIGLWLLVFALLHQRVLSLLVGHTSTMVTMSLGHHWHNRPHPTMLLYHTFIRGQGTWHAPITKSFCRPRGGQCSKAQTVVESGVALARRGHWSSSTGHPVAVTKRMAAIPYASGA